jgi:hypothetical protein
VSKRRKSPQLMRVRPTPTQATMTNSRACSALAALLLAGCGEDVNCPQGIFAAVSVHAVNAQDATPLIGARGVVSDGPYRDSLLEVGQGYYEGASGRAGLYAVHLELAGYAAWDTTGVLVQSTPGPCAMVETELLEARLFAAQ